MQRVIGLDVHSASSTLAVMGPSGRRLKSLVVETNAKELVDAVRSIAGRRRLCMEEGTQSEWLYEVLSPHVDELVVAGLGQSGVEGQRATGATPSVWRRRFAWARSKRASTRASVA